VSGPRPVMTTPTPQSILSGTSATFAWSPGSGVSDYMLLVGTHQAGFDVYNPLTSTTNLSALVTGLPTDGRTSYVRLWSTIYGIHPFTDYPSNVNSTRPVITAPTPGATLAGPSTTFAWTPGTGVTQYWLYVGSSPNSGDLYNQSIGANLSATVDGLPTDGRT